MTTVEALVKAAWDKSTPEHSHCPCGARLGKRDGAWRRRLGLCQKCAPWSELPERPTRCRECNARLRIDAPVRRERGICSICDSDVTNLLDNFVEDVEWVLLSGAKGGAVAQRLGVCKNTVKRRLQRAERGDLWKKVCAA